MAALAKQGHTAFAYDIAPPTAETLAVAPDLATRLRTGQIGDIARLFEVCRSEKIEAIVHAAEHRRTGTIAGAAARDLPDQYHGTGQCLRGRRGNCRCGASSSISSNAAYHKGSGEHPGRDRPAFLDPRRQSRRALRHLQDGWRGHRARLCDVPGCRFPRVRITAIYGFGMRSPMYIKPMVENAVLGQPTRFATGGPMKRDYTHVLDCSDGIVAALRRRDGPQASSGSSMSPPATPHGGRGCRDGPRIPSRAPISRSATP